MSDVVRTLFSTAGAVLALLVAAVWIWRRPHSPSARRFLLAAAAGYTMASVYAVPAIVARGLSAGFHRFTPADAPRGATAIVVLGAGTQTIQGWDDRFDLMSDVEAARVLETWRVFKLIAPAVVISSGGLPHPDDFSEPSGMNMRDELVHLGVPGEKIVVEVASRDTHDEAVLIPPLLRARGIDRIVLVTSDAHMRRSLGAFRAQGWNAVPAIAPDPNHDGPWLDWLIPSPEGLELSGQVSHELVGLPYYWLRGWWRR